MRGNPLTGCPVDRRTLQRVVREALREDIGRGDLTTMFTVPADTRARGELLAKQEGVMAGGWAVAECFRENDPGSEFEQLVDEGERFEPGQRLGDVQGTARGLLGAERVALNFLQHLCGVATLTRRFADELEGTGARVTDTRKTTPGLRALEKAAVVAGGGSNHRFALYDGILIKDNHIRLAGGIAQAIERAREGAPHTLRIEVETAHLGEVREALEAGADIIMLDNMDNAMMAKAVSVVDGRALVEASGGMRLERVRAVAELGVDLISVGRLTHSAPAIDISLELEIVS
ncbi:MAG: carboxylating nicotinate-nucleotide diphosphorylase [Armatimonadota bacterium]|nr:carboxylating nicotinate-nucleotide diphosphorylase [Armatimonadota bacterium]